VRTQSGDERKAEANAKRRRRGKRRRPETAVLASQLLPKQCAAPDFGDPALYRPPTTMAESVRRVLEGHSADESPGVRFPQPELVFVIDQLDQQTAERLLATKLPRPVLAAARFVSPLRRQYVEARHGPCPLSMGREAEAAAVSFYFETAGGRAYSSHVGRQGTDLLASQAHRPTMQEICAANVAPLRARCARGLVAGPGSVQAAALCRCRSLFELDFPSHSVASRAACLELRGYLAAHDHILFRPQAKFHDHLSWITSWLRERRAKANTLYQVHPGPRTDMLLRMNLTVLGANDPEVRGKIHHLALGPGDKGKSFCLNVAASWAVPGQAIQVSHKSAMADTVEQNVNGTCELWHEGNPKWFGVKAGGKRRRGGAAVTTPEESRFKSRLTEGQSVTQVCVSRGKARSLETYTRLCNGPLLVNLNARPEDVDAPTLSRFLVSDMWQNDQSSSSLGRSTSTGLAVTVAESICRTISPTLADARATDVATQRWLGTIMVLVHEMTRANALPAVTTPFTNLLLPRVLERARWIGGLLHTDEARNVTRVQAAVRTLTLVRAVQLVFGSAQSPLVTRRGNDDSDEEIQRRELDLEGACAFSPQHFALLPMHMSDCVDPTIISSALDLLRCQWPEDAVRWRTVEAILACFQFQGCVDAMAFVEPDSDTVGMMVVATYLPPALDGGSAAASQRLSGRAMRRRLGGLDGAGAWAVSLGVFPSVLLPPQRSSPPDVSRALMTQLGNQLTAQIVAETESSGGNCVTRAVQREQVRRVLADLAFVGEIGFAPGVGNSFDLFATRQLLRSPTLLKGRVLEAALADELQRVDEALPASGAHIFGAPPASVIELHAREDVGGSGMVCEAMKRQHFASLCSA
jgi:hypothetical protein